MGSRAASTANQLAKGWGITPRAIAAVGIALFLVLSLLVYLGALRGLDAAVMEAKSRYTSDALRAWSEIVAILVSAEFSVSYAAIAFLLLIARGLRAWALAPAGFLLGLPVEVAMKVFLYQPRVPSQFQHASSYPLIYVDLPWSFPSGHAMRTGFFMVFLAVLLWRRGDPFGRVAAVIALALVIPATYARVYMGHHWASDVVGGLLLGASLALLLAPPFARSLARPRAER